MSDTDPTMRAALAVLQRLLDFETDGGRPADGRRVVRDERQRLHVAIQHHTFGYLDAAGLRRQTAEGERVLSMWREVAS